jgi:hypothetical protein
MLRWQFAATLSTPNIDRSTQARLEIAHDTILGRPVKCGSGNYLDNGLVQSTPAQS